MAEELKTEDVHWENNKKNARRTCTSTLHCEIGSWSSTRRMFEPKAKNKHLAFLGSKPVHHVLSLPKLMPTALGSGSSALLVSQQVLADLSCSRQFISRCCQVSLQMYHEGYASALRYIAPCFVKCWRTWVRMQGHLWHGVRQVSSFRSFCLAYKNLGHNEAVAHAIDKLENNTDNMMMKATWMTKQVGIKETHVINLDETCRRLFPVRRVLV